MLTLSLVAKTLRVAEEVNLKIKRKPDGFLVSVSPLLGEAPANLPDELQAIRLALARQVYFTCPIEEIDTTFASLLDEATTLRIRTAVSYESLITDMKSASEAAERRASAKPKASAPKNQTAAVISEEEETEEEDETGGDGRPESPASAAKPAGDVDLFGT